MRVLELCSIVVYSSIRVRAVVGNQGSYAGTDVAGGPGAVLPEGAELL
jgi:hypothetical protein